MPLDVRSNSVPTCMGCFGCFCLLTTHTACPHIQKLPLATRLHNQYERDDLNKRSAKHPNKSTLIARGADTQLGSSCVSERLTWICGTPLTWRHWDARSTIRELQPKHRPVIFDRPSHHLRQRRVMGPMNVAWSVLRLQRHCSVGPTCTETGSFSNSKSTEKPTEKQNKVSVGHPRCSDNKTSSARDVSLLSLTLSSASVKTCMRRSANGNGRKTWEISDDDGKFTKCCYDDVRSS